MVLITVYQFINDEWKHLGNLQMATRTRAVNYIDELQEKLADPDVINVTLRENVKDLMVLNLQYGPVKFRVKE